VKIRNFFLIVSLSGIFALSPMRAQKPTQASSPTISTTQQIWRTYTNSTFYYSLVFCGGYLWTGTEGGVVRWNTSDGSYIKYTTVDGLAGNWVISIASDSTGNLWFGTWDSGVSMFDGVNWTTYAHADGLSDNHIMAIASDLARNVWFGTDYGVSKFDGTHWTTYTTADGLADNVVSAIASDPSGNIWVGTRGGVSKFDGATWTTYNSIGNWIWAIASDADGNLWFAPGSGVNDLYFIRSLNANYNGGAPGSFFNLASDYFPANQSVPVSANGHPLGYVPVSSNGVFTFTLSTSNADQGLYIVKVGERPSVQVRLALDTQGPMRPKEGNFTTFDLPPGIALTPRFYLPVFRR
jgi:hypothetical protein